MTMFWIKLMIAVFCAMYSLLFTCLGCCIAMSTWTDRHSIRLHTSSPLRCVMIVGVFFVAAIGFGYLTYLAIPL